MSWRHGCRSGPSLQCGFGTSCVRARIQEVPLDALVDAQYVEGGLAAVVAAARAIASAAHALATVDGRRALLQVPLATLRARSASGADPPGAPGLPSIGLRHAAVVCHSAAQVAKPNGVATLQKACGDHLARELHLLVEGHSLHGRMASRSFLRRGARLAAQDGVLDDGAMLDAVACLFGCRLERWFWVRGACWRRQGSRAKNSGEQRDEHAARGLKGLEQFM